MLYQIKNKDKKNNQTSKQKGKKMIHALISCPYGLNEVLYSGDICARFLE
jgi:hypothetical protein